MQKPIQIQKITLYNFTDTLYSARLFPHADFFIKLNREPNWVFTQEDDIFVAEDCGFLKGYLYQPGTSDGFSNNPITLLCKSGELLSEITFRGDLWGSAIAYQRWAEVNDTKVYPACYKVRDGNVVTACYITQQRLDEIKKYLTLSEAL